MKEQTFDETMQLIKQFPVKPIKTVKPNSEWSMDKHCPKCPDHDNDCLKVKNSALCFVGNKYLETAKGYCPLCQHPN